MLGMSYSIAIIQVNCEDAGNKIWTQIRAFPFAKDVERNTIYFILKIVLRVHYFDLSFMIIHGEAGLIERNRSIITAIGSQYTNLIRREYLRVEIVPNVVKNTIAVGVRNLLLANPKEAVDEAVDSVECMRMSLVFHGFAEALPSLTILSVHRPYFPIPVFRVVLLSRASSLVPRRTATSSSPAICLRCLQDSPSTHDPISRLLWGRHVDCLRVR